MIIAIDFDGTCVVHQYPLVGSDIGAAPVIRKFVERGDKIILFTMRSGEHLEAAVEWFSKNRIPLFGVNCNPDQHAWTTSPKPYANVYIDDAALGVPLVSPADGIRSYVDWEAVAKLMGVN